MVALITFKGRISSINLQAMKIIKFVLVHVFLAIVALTFIVSANIRANEAERIAAMAQKAARQQAAESQKQQHFATEALAQSVVEIEKLKEELKQCQNR